MIVQRETRYGSFEFIDNDNCIGCSLALYGEWAQREIDFLRTMITAGDVVVDVGANYGCHTVSFAHQVGKQGKVYAFEAQPILYERLVNNCRAAGVADQTVLINAIVDAMPGHSAAYAVDYELNANFGAISFVDHSPRATSATTDTIDRVTLDAMALDLCNLIKIDVEGMELEVIEGGWSTIERFTPILFFECNGLQQGWLSIERLKELGGYRFFLFSESPFNPDNFHRSTENLFHDYKESSLVALPESHHAMDHVAAQAVPIEDLDDFVTVLLSVPRSPEHPLEGIKGRIFKKYGTVANKLYHQLNQTEAAFEKTEQLAIARLNQVSQLETRLAETDTALEATKQLAIARLDQVSQLETRLLETDQALNEAKTLAVERMDQIIRIDKRLEQSDKLLEAVHQSLAWKMGLIKLRS